MVQDPGQPWAAPQPTPGSHAAPHPPQPDPAPGAGTGTGDRTGAGPHAAQPPSASQGPLPQSRPAPAPGSDLAADLTAAASWTWAAFSRNVAAFLVPGIIYGLIVLAIVTAGVVGMFPILFSALDATDPSAGGIDMGRVLLAYALPFAAGLVGGFVTMFWNSGTERAAVRIADGARPIIGEAMIGAGRIILTSLLCSVLVFAGMMLCYVPGLVLSFFLTFALPAAARGASPIAAVTESFRLVRNNVATTLVAMLALGAVTSMLGMLVVTIVVIAPLSGLFSFAMYERLSGRELRDPAAASAAA